MTLINTFTVPEFSSIVPTIPAFQEQWVVDKLGNKIPHEKFPTYFTKAKAISIYPLLKPNIFSIGIEYSYETLAGDKSTDTKVITLTGTEQEMRYVYKCFMYFGESQLAGFAYAMIGRIDAAVVLRCLELILTVKGGNPVAPTPEMILNGLSLLIQDFKLLNDPTSDLTNAEFMDYLVMEYGLMTTAQTWPTDKTATLLYQEALDERDQKQADVDAAQNADPYDAQAAQAANDALKEANFVLDVLTKFKTLVGE